MLSNALERLRKVGKSLARFRKVERRFGKGSGRLRKG